MAETTKNQQSFTDEERAAMKERAKEAKASKKGNKVDGEADVMAKIAEMPEAERPMATRLHELIKANAPDLSPRTWYGQPAYADKDGKIVCFFQNPSKFNIRYTTLGFNEQAHLDDGEFWPVAFALIELTPAVEEKIAALVKKAVS